MNKFKSKLKNVFEIIRINYRTNYANILDYIVYPYDENGDRGLLKTLKIDRPSILLELTRIITRIFIIIFMCAISLVGDIIMHIMLIMDNIYFGVKNIFERTQR